MLLWVEKSCIFKILPEVRITFEKSELDKNRNSDSLVVNYSQKPNRFYINLEHFALFASFAVHDFFHRKERKVRKDSLNGLVLNYN